MRLGISRTSVGVPVVALAVGLAGLNCGAGDAPGGGGGAAPPGIKAGAKVELWMPIFPVTNTTLYERAVAVTAVNGRWAQVRFVPVAEHKDLQEVVAWVKFDTVHWYRIVP